VIVHYTVTTNMIMKCNKYRYTDSEGLEWMYVKPIGPFSTATFVAPDCKIVIPIRATDMGLYG
jgi:hypothetical protein